MGIFSAIGLGLKTVGGFIVKNPTAAVGIADSASSLFSRKPKSEPIYVPDTSATDSLKKQLNALSKAVEEKCADYDQKLEALNTRTEELLLQVAIMDDQISALTTTLRVMSVFAILSFIGLITLTVLFFVL